MGLVRTRAGAFRWMRAAAFGSIAAAALLRTPFYPSGIALAAAAGIAVLGLLSPGVAVATVVVALGLPLLAADAAVGVVFLVVGLAAVQYLGQDQARAFLVIGLAFVASLLGLEWAVIALGGLVMASSEGMLAALLACAALETAGVLLGAPSMGATASGGREAVVAFARIPSPFGFGWLMPALRGIAPGETVAALRGSGPLPVLLAQPFIWAAGAGIAHTIGRRVPNEGASRLPLAALAAASGVATIGAGSAALSALGSPVAASSALMSAVGAAVVAAIGAVILETVFPRIAPAVPEPETGTHAEDADVDELLRLIASAEEELAAKHTVNATVMITDMKAFSAMTEEDGSVLSAKRIQRHRDLLLPIITAHGGRGKSTGGDGLVAAFEDASSALLAAVEMQQALDAFNAARASERALLVRVGIAFGEVLLDRSGRPFIGSGLNMAARIMDLGDGGEILASADVLSRAGRDAPASCRRGVFELKNIAGEVEVVEVIWAEDGQQATGA